MAEQAKTKAAPKKSAAKRGAAAKRKPAPKQQSSARGATARRPAARKSTTRKSASRKATAKQTGADIAARAQTAGRNAFLAGLGFYGKAYDGAQERYEQLQSRLKQRRRQADRLYRELVKRGEKVEKEARSALDEMELPRIELDTLTDRKKLEAGLEKARARFDELTESVGIKSAA